MKLTLTNDELRAALESKLRPNTTYTEQDLTAFALGVEWVVEYSGGSTTCGSESDAEDVAREHEESGDGVEIIPVTE